MPLDSASASRKAGAQGGESVALRRVAARKKFEPGRLALSLVSAASVVSTHSGVSSTAAFMAAAAASAAIPRSAAAQIVTGPDEMCWIDPDGIIHGPEWCQPVPPPPEPPPTYPCSDGSTVTDPAMCPVPPPPTYPCSDGSTVTDPAMCPVLPPPVVPPEPPPTYQCADGSTVTNPASCPVPPPPVVPPEPPPADPCEGYGVPVVSLSPSSINLGAGQSASATLTIYDGSYTGKSGGSKGTVSVSGSTVTYTANGNASGADSVNFSASNGCYAASGTLSVAISAAPVPVSAGATSASVPFNTPTVISLPASGAFSTVTLAQAPSHGSVTISGTQATFTPAAGYYGPDGFDYTASGVGGSATGHVNLTIGNPPAPVATGGNLTAAYQTAASIVLGATGIATSVSLVATPAHGSVSISGGQATYTPASGYVGPDSFSYIAQGPGGMSAPAVVNVTVAAPGAPVVQGATAVTDMGLLVNVPLAVSGDYFTVVIADQPAHGMAAVSGTTASYKPDAGFSGPDNFTVVAKGPGGDSAAAPVAVQVFEPPPPPEPQEPPPVPPPPGFPCADGSIVTDPAACPAPPPPVETIQANPAEAATRLNTPVAMNLEQLVEGRAKSLSLVRQARNGEVRIDEGEAVYTPRPDFAGTDDFIYRATAASGLSAEATVTVSVAPGDLPVALNATTEGVAGTPIRVDVAQGAANGPIKSVEIVEGPFIGTVTVDETSLVLMTPAAFQGDVTVRFVLRNAWGASEPATLVAKVLAAPVVKPVILAQVLAGKTVTVSLTDGATGGPFTSANLVSMSPQDAGTATIGRLGEGFALTFTPKGRFTGTADVEYTLSNANATSMPGLVRISVNDRPNPAKDAEVTGLISAQRATMSRFASAQSTNVLRRLESLHGGRGRNSFALGLPIDRDPMGERREQARAELDGLIRGRSSSHEFLTDGNTGLVQRAPGRVSVWASGALDFGFNRDGVNRAKFKFNTSGLSAGMDAAVSDRLSIGAGVGYGRDESKIGANGTKSRSSAVSIFGYGSYQPTPTTFLDAVLGVTRVGVRNDRYLTANGGMVSGRRDGRQVFGAVSIGWEHAGPRLLVSPYGRLEFAWTELNGYAEQGDDTFALRFDRQKLSDLTGVVGLRGQYRVDVGEGEILPTFRMEYRKRLQSGGAARMTYGDWADSPVYVATPSIVDDESLVLGLGADIRLLKEWSFSADVETTIADRIGRSMRVRAGGARKF